MAFNFGDIMGGLGQGLMGLFSGGHQSQPSYVNRAMTNPTNIAHFQQNGMPNFPQMQQGGNNGVMSMFSKGQNPGMMGAGLGVMGLGQLLNKQTKMPDFNQNQSVQQLNNWSSQANHPMDPNVAQAMQNTLNIQNEQQLRNLRDVYKNLRPGTDYTTDSNYQRDLGNLNRSIGQNNADAMAGQQFKSNEQQIGNLTNMAQLGVGQQMGNANLQAQRQQNQNEMFGNIGSMLLQSGIGMPDFMKMFNRGQI